MIQHLLKSINTLDHYYYKLKNKNLIFHMTKSEDKKSPQETAASKSQKSKSSGGQLLSRSKSAKKSKSQTPLVKVTTRASGKSIAQNVKTRRKAADAGIQRSVVQIKSQSKKILKKSKLLIPVAVMKDALGKAAVTITKTKEQMKCCESIVMQALKSA